MLKAHLWHIRSRSTWFKIEDAPRSYFFMLVTTKRICEIIKKLVLDDGRVIEDESKILHGIYNHCRNLYRRDSRVVRFITHRDEVLSLITRNFSKEDNQVLMALPSEDDIDRIVLGFPKGKSPGGDGVTYDFFQGC